MRFQHHIQTAVDSLQQLRHNPWSNAFTMVVIGIALALPVILAVILSHVQTATKGWDVGNQITVFLKDSTTENQAKKLVEQIRQRDDVARVDYLTREQSLEEFRTHSGFSEALALLPSNPFPAVIIIHPAQAQNDAALMQWAEQLKKMSTIEFVQFDKEWLQRLGALISLLDRAIMILGGLLVIAVGLIIGNTIRLMIQNRQEEIKLVMIIGATNRFVRRPFLYTGVWFGIGGGAIACILVSIGLLSLKHPVIQLAGLYNSQFLLSGMSFPQITSVLLLSALSGCISAYIVVTHYLRNLTP